MCDSNHFTFPELSRWSVLYSEINTLVNIALVKSSQLWGGKGRRRGGLWRKQHLAGLCSGLPTALMDLR